MTPTPKKMLQSAFHFPEEQTLTTLSKQKHPRVYWLLRDGKISQKVHDRQVKLLNDPARDKRFHDKFKKLREDILSKGEGPVKTAKSKDLKKLIKAKAYSDKRDYFEKNKILGELMTAKPKDFKVDSILHDNYVGLTHKPSGFKIHAPRTLVPIAVEKKAFLKEAEADDTIFDIVQKNNIYKLL